MKLPNPLDLLDHATDLGALTKIDDLPTIKVEPTLPTSKIDLDLPSKIEASTTADVVLPSKTPLITSVPISSRDTSDDDEPTSPVERPTSRLTTDDDEETTTRRATATSEDDDLPRATKTADDDDSASTKSTSRTPTMDNLVPTTMVTMTSSSSSFSYPYPTSMIKAGDNDSMPKNETSELEKVQNSLKTYKIHYRNMIIALTLFALLIVAFIAFKIWWTCFRAKKKVATMGVKTVLEGGRGWFGAARKGKEMYEMHQAKKAGTAPGGAQYI